MKVKDLLIDHGIPFSEHGKNIQQGWIGLNCPFCPDPSTHLGYNLNEPMGEVFNCWRCGSHSAIDTIAELIGIDKQRAKQIIHQYSGISEIEEPEILVGKKAFKYPPNTGDLDSIHKTYLTKRGFNPLHLTKQWGVMGIGPISIMDKKDHRFRILIPVYWNDRIVSWQTRDVTGSGEPKYINCPKDRELIHNKNIVYGMPNLWTRTTIVTEGVTDVWRLGPTAVATLGISYTPKQLITIAKNFDNIAVLFDIGSQAQEKANQMIKELRFMGKRAWNITVEDDPASLTQEEADILVKEVINL